MRQINRVLREFSSDDEADTNLGADRECIFRWGPAVAALWESPDRGRVSLWMASGPGTPLAKPYVLHGNWGAAAGHGHSRTSWPAGSAAGRHHQVVSWDWAVPAEPRGKKKLTGEKKRKEGRSWMATTRINKIRLLTKQNKTLRKMAKLSLVSIHLSILYYFSRPGFHWQQSKQRWPVLLLPVHFL